MVNIGNTATLYFELPSQPQIESNSLSNSEDRSDASEPYLSEKLRLDLELLSPKQTYSYFLVNSFLSKPTPQNAQAP
jgi:hypothetical protein